MSFSPKWSHVQEAELIRRWPDDSLNGSPDIIARDFGRSEGAIHRKAHKLGLPWKTRVTPRPDKGPSTKFNPWPDDMPDYKDNPRAAAMPFSAGVAMRAGLIGMGHVQAPTQTVMADLGSASSAGRRHGANIRLDRGAE